jgi:peptidoglycan hydrolase CwlO-like protein|tara:strand:- start:1562 stop:1930 length:369 start_codon:yes stop_codon:yes gene_type:complete
MDWFKTKGAQLIAFAGIVSTLAGFGYTGAEYVNRITNLEKKISRVEGTEDAQQEIEERFSAIETSVSYINKSIDDSIMPEIKENSNMIKVIDVDISTATTKIDALDNRVKRIEDQDDNPLAN